MTYFSKAQFRSKKRIGVLFCLKPPFTVSHLLRKILILSEIRKKIWIKKCTMQFLEEIKKIRDFFSEKSFLVIRMFVLPHVRLHVCNIVCMLNKTKIIVTLIKSNENRR